MPDHLLAVPRGYDPDSQAIVGLMAAGLDASGSNTSRDEPGSRAGSALLPAHNIRKMS